MSAIRRRDEGGVSEVVGTILILAMTVVLFSTIVLWVTGFPTPVGRTQLDLIGRMDPIYNPSGAEIGVNITLVHHGGNPLEPTSVVLYVTSSRGGGPPQTDTLRIRLYNGLLDGQDTAWEVGERWAYRNYTLLSSDRVDVSIVDTQKNALLWSARMDAPPGTRPPVFVDKWADGNWATTAVDAVEASRGFYLFVSVGDPDGDLDPNSVFAMITAWYGSATLCENPLPMRDDGIFPDRVAGDEVFTLGATVCTNPPYPAMSWAGSIILLNATDRQGHQTTSRFVLEVVAPSGQTVTQTIPSALWQYIGFVQIRAGEVWVTNLNKPYSTTIQHQPYRITRLQLNGDGGPLFHLQMANHGNRTIFLDGWTVISFSAAARSSVSSMYIVQPVDPNRPANAGGIAAYPGTASNPNNFQYAQVFDIEPLDQETGGTPLILLMAAKSAFRADWPQTFVSDSYFLNILVSGMAGPVNMTYSEILARWGPSYNPLDHLNDPDPATRTQWYAQVIPFIGMTVY